MIKISDDDGGGGGGSGDGGLHDIKAYTWNFYERDLPPNWKSFLLFILLARFKWMNVSNTKIK